MALPRLRGAQSPPVAATMAPTPEPQSSAGSVSASGPQGFGVWERQPGCRSGSKRRFEWCRKQEGIFLYMEFPLRSITLQSLHLFTRLSSVAPLVMTVMPMRPCFPPFLLTLQCITHSSWLISCPVPNRLLRSENRRACSWPQILKFSERSKNHDPDRWRWWELRLLHSTERTCVWLADDHDAHDNICGRIQVQLFILLPLV